MERPIKTDDAAILDDDEAVPPSSPDWLPPAKSWARITGREPGERVDDCDAPHPESAIPGCTRAVGHDGDHAAHGPNDVQYYRWPQT